MKAKTFSILGDSISTFERCNPPENEVFYPREGCDVFSKEHTWWHLLEEETGLQLIINEAYSGSRISETGDRPPSSSFLAQKRQHRLCGDIILVFGGTNDFGQAENPATLAEFAEAYNRLVEQMVETHHQSTLYFCTPPQRCDKARDENNVHGWNQDDLSETIRDAVQAHPGARLIDLYAHPIEEGDGMLFDGLHPTRKGMRMIASLIKAKLENSSDEEIGF